MLNVKRVDTILVKVLYAIDAFFMIQLSSSHDTSWNNLLKGLCVEEATAWQSYTKSKQMR